MNLLDGNKVYGYLHIARDSLTMLETMNDFSIIDREEFTQLLAEIRTNLERINDMILECDLKNSDL